MNEHEHSMFPALNQKYLTKTFFCSKCGGSSELNTLPLHCPNAPMTDNQIHGVMCGFLNYINNRWITLREVIAKARD